MINVHVHGFKWLIKIICLCFGYKEKTFWTQFNQVIWLTVAMFINKNEYQNKAVLFLLFIFPGKDCWITYHVLFQCIKNQLFPSDFSIFTVGVFINSCQQLPSSPWSLWASCSRWWRMQKTSCYIYETCIEYLFYDTCIKSHNHSGRKYSWWTKHLKFALKISYTALQKPGNGLGFHFFKDLQTRSKDRVCNMDILKIT